MSLSANFAGKLEPYKRIIGLLVGSSKISVATSTPYLQFAEPNRDILVRLDKQPILSIERIINETDFVGGVVLGGCL